MRLFQDVAEESIQEQRAAAAAAHADAERARAAARCVSVHACIPGECTAADCGAKRVLDRRITSARAPAPPSAPKLLQCATTMFSCFFVKDTPADPHARTHACPHSPTAESSSTHARADS